MDNYPISSNSLEKHYHIKGNYFGQQYKDSLSDFHSWEQKSHAAEWVLYPENISSHLSIDETALTNGELCTIITSKAGKGKKGTLVAMIAGTKAQNIIKILEKIPQKIRDNRRGNFGYG